jgi:hypothetical protein
LFIKKIDIFLFVYDAENAFQQESFFILFRQLKISSELFTEDNTFRISVRCCKPTVIVGVDTG